MFWLIKTRMGAMCQYRLDEKAHSGQFHPEEPEEIWGGPFALKPRKTYTKEDGTNEIVRLHKSDQHHGFCFSLEPVS